MDWLKLVTLMNLILSFMLVLLLARFKLVRVKRFRVQDKQGCSLLERYLEKSENYRKAGKDAMALLMLRNAFINFRERPEVFKLYVDGLLQGVEISDSQEERARYLEEAEKALLDFSEKADPDNFALVETYQNKIYKYKREMVKRAS